MGIGSASLRGLPRCVKNLLLERLEGSSVDRRHLDIRPTGHPSESHPQRRDHRRPALPTINLHGILQDQIVRDRVQRERRAASPCFKLFDPPEMIRHSRGSSRGEHQELETSSLFGRKDLVVHGRKRLCMSSCTFGDSLEPLCPYLLLRNLQI